MPTHKNRSAGGAKLHQRTVSAGSSKIGLNLHFTQKEALTGQPKQERPKRNGHSAVDLHTQRAASQYPRNQHISSSSRVQSKERLHLHHQKRPQTPLSAAKRDPAPNHKVDFTISRSDGTDEDEWVSSESGAATPQDSPAGAMDDRQLTATSIAQTNSDPEEHVNGTTPRAEPEIHRVATARAATAIESSREHPQRAEWPSVEEQPVEEQPAQAVATTSSTFDPPEADAFRPTRSEAPSPTSRRLDSRRHLSTHDPRAEMPPHPLIRRGLSYQGSLKPAPLPLKVNAEAAHAQITTSPTFARQRSSQSSPAVSAVDVVGSPAEVHFAQPTRKSSSSSLHSVATLPAPSSTNRLRDSRMRQDRTRTLSTFSTSSMSAALSSLSATASGAGTPPMTVHFPAEGLRDTSDFHKLLPTPFLTSHLTVLARNTPLADSYNRVMKAKYGH